MSLVLDDVRRSTRSDALQVRRGKLAALAHHIIVELLTLIEVAHPRALDRGNMDEYVISAIGGLDESEALLGIKKLDDTLSHSWPPMKRQSASTAARPSRSLQSEFGVVLGADSKSRQNLEPSPYRQSPVQLQLIASLQVRSFAAPRTQLASSAAEIFPSKAAPASATPTIVAATCFSRDDRRLVNFAQILFANEGMLGFIRDRGVA
jgi:hypothetical protein